MTNWDAANEDSNDSRDACLHAAEKDASDARAVSTHLNIPFHRVSLASEYWTQVFEPFVEGVSCGIMPNPDVRCNSKVKFGAMKQYATQVLKATHISTGHYARLYHGTDDDEILDSLFQSSRSTSSSSSSSTSHRYSSLEQLLHSPLQHDDVSLGTTNASTTTTPSNVTLPNTYHHPYNPEEDYWLYEWMGLTPNSTSTTSSIHHRHRPSSDNNTPVHHPLLLSGIDQTKDQSYFLCHVPSPSFHNVIFPLGHLIKKKKLIHPQKHTPTAVTTTYTTTTKNISSSAKESSTNPLLLDDDHDYDHDWNHLTVREIANLVNLPTASKRESMGICFVGKRNFANFISGYLPLSSNTMTDGHFLDVDTGQVSVMALP
eukprot:CAMPEP_0184866178 /NCGR_PEP_ID=MMETSP0580-20130426/21217_1 /TAXON_ID=1118495 /ORGANISM="Dactyliosolen fragilissimus" /LENGTH=372 /DNA_ID=CAMNT_0027365709 /DNA_START=126 /DNA_END=1244 /DNA_ORIENTATION=-